MVESITKHIRDEKSMARGLPLKWLNIISIVLLLALIGTLFYFQGESQVVSFLISPLVINSYQLIINYYYCLFGHKYKNIKQIINC